MKIRNHLDGKIDTRYTVAKEFCGMNGQRFIARFCGTFIDKADTAKEAWILAQEHYDNHKIDYAGAL
jgi:hypothetical protein